mgnify:CR=1 FL=1
MANMSAFQANDASSILATCTKIIALVYLGYLFWYGRENEPRISEHSEQDASSVKWVKQKKARSIFFCEWTKKALAAFSPDSKEL